MPKLTDTQTLLLSAASQRDTGSLYPLPGDHTSARVEKAVAGLLTAGLFEERETRAIAEAHRSDADRRFGLYVTAAGLSAIGLGTGPAEAELEDIDLAVASPSPAPGSKSATILALLARADGATMPELIAVTGWLPHTIRAALTGLRKKGHAIERSRREGATCYRVAAAVAVAG